MKEAIGWWWPDGEQHMLEWMVDPRNKLELNGRLSYQGKKQLAALSHASQHFGRPLQTIVDVGAHIGLWAYNLAPACVVLHAFEPVEVHRECFKRNVLAQNVALHAVALGRERGRVNVWSNPTSSGDSWVKGDGDIPMETLDSYHLGNVDLLKIDCEGYEENVLRGAEGTILLCKPVVVIEQKRDMAVKFGLEKQGGVNLLLELGYRVAQEISGDYICVPT
jgi:FkbM family methyltransferase